MNNKIFIIGLFIIFSFTGCVRYRINDVNNSYSINLDEKFLIRDNEYSINENFNFIVKSEKPIKGIFVVISPKQLEIDKFIGKEIDNTIFSLGNMLIKDKNEEETVLFYNDNLVNIYLSSNEAQGSTSFSIPIKGILSQDSSDNNLKLFCYAFNDLNNNAKIDEAEIQSLIINYCISEDMNDVKIYISTVGYKVRNYKNIFNDYTVYKINSYEKLQKFKDDICQKVANFDSIFVSKDDFKNNIHLYIIHSPVTNNIFLSQPYKFANSNLLIFDVEIQENNENEYIAARNYMVMEKNDNLKICINKNGKLFFPLVIEY